MRTLLVLIGLVVMTSCSAAPSYTGGPTLDEPYGVVTPIDRVSLWKIDGKNTRSRNGESYLSPGAHTLKCRVEYTVEYEGEGNFEWKDVPIEVKDGTQYFLVAKPEGAVGERTLDLPPYMVVVEERTRRR
jgi:hypothetical protein